PHFGPDRLETDHVERTTQPPTKHPPSRRPIRSLTLPKHAKSGSKHLSDRRFHTCGNTRHVASTGYLGANTGLRRCATFFSFRFPQLPGRRFFFRRPPHVGNRNCICFAFAFPFLPTIPPPPPRTPPSCSGTDSTEGV